MKRLLAVFILLAVILAGAVSSVARDDFLNPEEVDKIRDAEDSAKRVMLYLQFAQKRLDAAREKTISWKQAGAGEAIQKNLEEYTSILEALDDSLQNAREERAEMAKPLKEMETQANHFLRILQQLNNAPIRGDYQFTLDEAIAMTNDELAEVKKGAFPEVQERKPPVNFPSTPPPLNSPSKAGTAQDGPPRKSGAEEGPPRKSSASQPASSSSSEEGPPRKPGRTPSKSQ